MIRGGFPCVFQRLTGLYCPGCGGTRAARYLLHGEIAKSLQYHPLIGYMALVIFLELISWGLARLWKKPNLHLKRYDGFVYLGIAIIVVNWIWKNYMLVVRGIDLLP